jgi:hypothetical protein
MDNIEIASTYRMNATLFRMSAEVLFHDIQKRGEQLPGNVRAIPFYYLISHTFELLLKCALLKRGASVDALKKYPLGHSLSKQLEMLKGFGVPVSENTDRVIGILSSQHEKHVLRYSALIDDGESTFTPEPELLFTIADELLMAGRIATHGV